MPASFPAFKQLTRNEFYLICHEAYVEDRAYCHNELEYASSISSKPTKYHAFKPLINPCFMVMKTWLYEIMLFLDSEYLVC